MLRVSLQLILLVCVAIYVWRRGGWPERSVAVLFVMMGPADILYHSLFQTPVDYQSVDLGHLAIDLACFLGTLWVALKADRIWTLWVASSQLISLMSHLWRLIDWTMQPMAYAILTMAPSYIAIVLIAWGTWNWQRRSQTRTRLTYSSVS